MTVEDAHPPVSVPARVLSELYEHALQRAEDGEECCGLIVSDETSRYAEVVRCTNIMTQLHEKTPADWPRDNRSAYYMDPKDLLPWLQEGATDRVSAIYHSHVGVAATLSAMDIEYAASPAFPFPDADQIVLSVADNKVDEARLFRRTGPGAEFAPLVIEPEHA